MADQPNQPPKKVGSLRDRIAAFEKGPSSGSGPTPTPGPPPPRPKPAGFGSWKPKPPSPPASPGRPENVSSSADKSPGPSAGMSVFDAKDSIVKGGSLKDRMAALQGKGGFGSSPPTGPKPPLEKPKWKPPPVIAPPSDDEEDQAPKAAAVPSSPPPPARKSSSGETLEAALFSEKEASEPAEEKESGDVDPEEEERQRRAAIAARLARLGGTRVGMAPIFGKKPPPAPARKPSLPPQGESPKADAAVPPTSPPPQAAILEEPKLEESTTKIVPEVPIVASPPTLPEVPEALSPEPLDKPTAHKASEAHSTSEGTSETPQTSRSPISMPVPAMPRRAAPPRKKSKVPSAPKAEESAQKPTESSQPISDLSVAEVAATQTEEVQKSAQPSEMSPSQTQEPSTAKEAATETHTDPPAERSTPVTEQPPVEEKQDDHENSASPDDEASKTSSNPAITPVATEAPLAADIDAGVKDDVEMQDEHTDEVEDEDEDEDERRRKVAERLSRMGGVNPFAIPTMPKRQSTLTSSSPTSTPPAATAEETTEEPPAVPRSRSPSPEPELTDTLKNLTLDDAPDLASAAPKTDQYNLESSGEKTDANKETVRRSTGDSARSQYDDGGDVEVTPVFSNTVPRAQLEEIEETDVRSLLDSTLASIPVPPPHASQVPQQHTPPKPTRTPDQCDPTSERESVLDEQETSPSPSLPQVPQINDQDEDHTPPLPIPRRVSVDRSSVQSDASGDSQGHFAPPRRNVPPPPPPPPLEEAYSDEDSGSDYESEDALPVRPPSITHRPPQGQEDFPLPPETPLIVPPPTSPRQGHQPPPRALPQAPDSEDGGSTLAVPKSTEVLDEEEGDPIDPSFHSPSRRASTHFSPPSVAPVALQRVDVPRDTVLSRSSEEKDAVPEHDEDAEAEAASRQTIAARMAKLGGIKFGAAPPVPSFKRQSISQPSESEKPQGDDARPHEEDVGEVKSELTEEEEERARKERIAAKMATMGGMRIGMLPPTFPPRKPSIPTAAAEPEVPKSPPPPTRAPPAPRRAPPPQVPDSESEQESIATSDDAVKVEAEESEIEEVTHEDALPEREQTPPPVPSRSSRGPPRRESVELASSPPQHTMARPPVPAGLPQRRGSGQTVTSQRRASGESINTQRMPIIKGSEYVMVEEPEKEEVPPPVPAGRPSARGAPTRAPPPPEVQSSLSSQWELPSIPHSTLEFGNESDMSMSWTEAEAPKALEESITIIPSPNEMPQRPVHAPPPAPEPVAPAPPPPQQKLRRANDSQLSGDDLMVVWGRVGVQVCEVATDLFEKSRKGVIGDGTYAGFVRTVLAEVPNAALTSDWGYIVYKQSGAAVQKRVAEIMPGDLVEFVDARFKGHKGLHGYQQSVGVDESLIGVVSEFEPRKSKLRVFHASQHVGQQSVETVSYRLDDLKSGVMTVYRVLEA